MRRKPNPQKRKSNSTAPRATPPSSAASPSWPMTAASTRPSIGVERWASVMGTPIARTALLVTVTGRTVAAPSTGSARTTPALEPFPFPRNRLSSSRDRILFTRAGSTSLENALAPAGRGGLDEADHEPDWHHDHGTQEKITEKVIEDGKPLREKPLHEASQAGDERPGRQV